MQVTITLPDGSTRIYPAPVTGGEIAASIGAGLAKAAVVVRVDGELKDLTAPIERDARIAIVTRDVPAALQVFRPHPAHALAVPPNWAHPPSSGSLGPAFEAMEGAVAYWGGDAKNAQVQRVYGPAWANDKGLARYLTMLEEAEKRDHRRRGRELDLFHQQEEAVGSVFWHPKGWTLWRVIENYLPPRL